MLTLGRLLQRCAMEMGELRDYVDGLGGGHLTEEGWSLTMKLRTTGTQAGLLYDRTFRAPDGAKYRSKVGAYSLDGQHSVSGACTSVNCPTWPATCCEDVLTLLLS